MKNFSILFLIILSAIALSFTSLVLSSYIQLGGLTQSTETLDENGELLEGEPLFPVKMSGVAQQGKAIYENLGCVYCHTQQVRGEGCGADIERGWGKRVTVARDYVMQNRPLIGSQRLGSDLTTIGERQPDASWHHLLLYDPRIISEGLSTMPRYPFLYKMQKIEESLSANALRFEEGSAYAPKEGYEVVPTRRAEALVEY